MTAPTAMSAARSMVTSAPYEIPVFVTSSRRADTRKYRNIGPAGDRQLRISSCTFGNASVSHGANVRIVRFAGSTAAGYSS